MGFNSGFKGLINYVAVSSKYCKRVFVFVPQLSGIKKLIFSMQHYIVLYGVSGCTIHFSTLTHKRNDFRGGEIRCT